MIKKILTLVLTLAMVFTGFVMPTKDRKSVV